MVGRGFDVVVPSIPAGVTREIEVEPHGETGVSVVFEVAGRRIVTPPQGYVEDYDSYVVEFVVREDFSVIMSKNDLEAK